MTACPWLTAVDYIEFYVDNAIQAGTTYSMALGLSEGPSVHYEVCGEHLASVLLTRNDIRFILTSSEEDHGCVAEHVAQHGFGVRDIAFAVDDIETVFKRALAHGARPIQEPREVQCGSAGRLAVATFSICGSLVHSLVEREPSNQWFAPNLPIVDLPTISSATGLLDIDHMAIVVPNGDLELATDFYGQALGFEEFLSEVITTEHSGMSVKGIRSAKGTITFTLIEPALGMPMCQLDDYLTRHRGAGVQHIALRSENIVATIRMLSSDHVSFVRVPPKCNEEIKRSRQSITESINYLRALNIFVDETEDGQLMQAFTRPLLDRDTGFFEIIERRGAQGFGLANIKALFEAVEMEQRFG